LPARLNPWLKVHAVYASGITVFFAAFQYFLQEPATSADWARYAVEVVVKTTFLHALLWAILIRPAANSYRRIASGFAETSQFSRLDREVTPVAVLDKRIQRLEDELKRREAERRS
jgi:hypothetical protein